MNWKQSIDRFRGLLNKYSHEKGNIYRPTNATIMAELSLTQQEWGNKFRLNEVATFLNLTANQSTYAIGTELPTDILDFKNIDVVNECPISRINKSEMDCIEKHTGLPTKYTVYGTNDERVFEIDSTPDKSYAQDSDYRLTYQYTRRFDYFSGASGTFADYDETEADFGGEWTIPVEYHGYLVEYSAARYCNDAGKMMFWEDRAQKIFDTAPIYLEDKLDYKLGV